MFNANFLINETTYVKGTYTFEFTIGTINKKFTVNVVDLPSLKISSLLVGTAQTSLFNGVYQLKNGTHAGKITMAFTKTNITDNEFVTIEATPSFASGLTLPTSDPISLKDLKSLDLGTLASATRSENDKIYYVVNFWKQVPFSTSSSRYQLTGEQQKFVVGFDAGLDITTLPALTGPSFAVGTNFNTEMQIGITSSVTGTAYYVIYLATAATPTVSQIVAQGTAVSKGTFAVTAATGATATATGLTAATAYKLHLVVIGNTGNVSAVYSSSSVTTAANVTPTLLTSTIASTGVVTVSTAAGNDNNFSYLIVPTANQLAVSAILTSITATTTEVQLLAKINVIVEPDLTLAALTSASTDIGTSAENTKYLLVIEEITATGVIVKYSYQAIAGIA